MPTNFSKMWQSELWCLGKTVTNQNRIPEEIKSRPNSGSAWYCVHCALICLPTLYVKTVKVKIYKIVKFISYFTVYGFETLSVNLTEEHRLKVFRTVLGRG